jgi:hypothetical protein
VLVEKRVAPVAGLVTREDAIIVVSWMRLQMPRIKFIE